MDYKIPTEIDKDMKQTMAFAKSFSDAYMRLQWLVNKLTNNVDLSDISELATVLHSGNNHGKGAGNAKELMKAVVYFFKDVEHYAKEEWVNEAFRPFRYCTKDGQRTPESYEEEELEAQMEDFLRQIEDGPITIHIEKIDIEKNSNLGFDILDMVADPAAELERQAKEKEKLAEDMRKREEIFRQGMQQVSSNSDESTVRKEEIK